MPIATAENREHKDSKKQLKNGEKQYRATSEFSVITAQKHQIRLKKASLFGGSKNKYYLCGEDKKKEAKKMVSYIMSNEALREEIGMNLRQMRLNANLSQQELADKCGLARSTVAAFEAGKGGTLDTMILMLRFVQQLHVLDAFEVAAPQSPLAMARNMGKTPQRIYKRKSANAAVDRELHVANARRIG